MNVAPIEEYLTVAEAAALIRVNRSTIRRWISAGMLPASRVGARRLALRRADLVKLVTPLAPRPGEQGMIIHPSLDRSSLSAEERRRGLAAMDEADRLRQEILAQRGGQLFTPESWELLNESRDERSRELA